MSPRARLFRNALLMWLVLLALAFANGALRELVLAPLIGGPALAASGLTALLAFAVAIALFVRRARPALGDAVVIGLAWFALTLGLETLLFVAQGRPASLIGGVFAWRTIAGGNLFAVLVVFVAVAPALFAWTLRR